MKKVLGIVTMCIGFSLAVISQSPGDLDLSFSDDGTLISTISDASDTPYAMKVQEDGKILVAGSTNESGTLSFLLARYESNGALDGLFGTAGLVQNAWGDNVSIAYAIEIDSDSRILLAGSVDGKIGVARYLSDGSPDPDFGNNGIVITDLGAEYARANGIALQSDGSIVVSGYAGSIGEYNFLVIRYTTNGDIDTSFATQGIANLPVGLTDDEAFGMAIQNDDKIVVGGWAYNGLDTDFAMIRLEEDGVLDITFSEDGLLMSDFGGSYDEIHALQIQADGKIVVTGYSWLGDTWALAIARYTEAGNLDINFGDGGVKYTNIGEFDESAYAISIQEDGKIIISGYINVITGYDFVVVRYTVDGQLDEDFGEGGIVITEITESYNRIHASAIQPDGKLIVSGYTYDDKSGYNFGLARYHTEEFNAVHDSNSDNKAKAIVYPNPCSNFITLNIENMTGPMKIDFCCMTGQSIHSFKNISLLTQQNNLSLEIPESIPSGMYILKLTSESSSFVVPIMVSF